MTVRPMKKWFGPICGAVIFGICGGWEALFVASRSPVAGGANLLWFVLSTFGAYAVPGALLGFLDTLLLGLVWRGNGPGQTRSRHSLVVASLLGLSVLLYGGFWVNVKLLPGLKFYSPRSIFFDCLVLVGSLIVLGVSWVVTKSLWRVLGRGRLLSLTCAVVASGGLILGRGASQVLSTFSETHWSLATLRVGLAWLSGSILLGGIVYKICWLWLRSRRECRQEHGAGGRSFRVGFLLFGLLLVLSLLPLEGRSRPRPSGRGNNLNVLIITLDALRADHLSCYGYGRQTSPTMDRVAEEGIRMGQAISSASFTNASLGSLLTGKYPPHHGARSPGSLLDSSNVTLAEVLRAAGYRTGAVVSNGIVNRHQGYAQGFDYYDESGRVNFRAYRPLFLYWALAPILPQARGMDTPSTLKASLAWLTKVHEHPFFLWIHFIDPHRPYAPPPPYNSLFDPTRNDAEFTPKLEKQVTEAMLKHPGMDIRQFLSPADFQHYTALYDGEVKFVDDAIGRIIQELKTWGVYDKTLLVISADHGEGLGEHGQGVFYAHGPLIYEPTVHIPLIFRCPGRLPSGEVVTEMVRQIDIMPTVLDAVECPAPGGMDGMSLLPLMRGDKTKKPSEAYIESTRLSSATSKRLRNNPWIRRSIPGIAGKRRAIRTEEYKLIYTPQIGDPRYELYDEKRDPQELVNLYAVDNPVAQKLKSKLLEWIMSCDEGAAEHEGAVDQQTQENLKALGYVLD